MQFLFIYCYRIFIIKFRFTIKNIPQYIQFLHNLMSSNKKKFTVNPATGRSIAIGGRMWRKMVKSGIIENDSYERTGNFPDSSNVLYTVNEDEYETEEQMKEEVYKQKERFIRQYCDPDASGYVPNKRPMVYKNKVIMGNNKLTTEEVSKRTADAAIEVIDQIQNNEEQIPQNMTRKEAHDYLQGLIFDKMISNKKKFVNSRLEPVVRKEPEQRRVKIKHSTVERKQKLKPLKRVPKRKENQQLKEERRKYIDSFSERIKPVDDDRFDQDQDSVFREKLEPDVQQYSNENDEQQEQQYEEEYEEKYEEE